MKRKRPCPFCEDGTLPYFGEVAALERFLTDRGKIIGRKRTSVCAKHQRRLTREVKRARFLALLPFVEHG